MTLGMYQASVPVLIKALSNLQNVLAKADAHAKAKGIDDANFTSMRLMPDMLPFTRQIFIACDVAKGGVSRLAGADIPSHADVEVTFVDLIARCQKVIDHLGAFKPEQIDGSEDKDISLKSGGRALSFKGKDYLFQFVLPNVYFHSTVAYALLRSAGVELGKMDYLGE
jgi:uncharacterized protein